MLWLSWDEDDRDHERGEKMCRQRGWQHAFRQLRICEILFIPLPRLLLHILYEINSKSSSKSKRPWEIASATIWPIHLSHSLPRCLSPSFSHQLQLQFRFQFQFQFHYDLWPLAAVQQADKVNRKPKIITMPAIINIHFDRLIIWSFFTWCLPLCHAPLPPPALIVYTINIFLGLLHLPEVALDEFWSVLFCSVLFFSVQTYQNFEMLIEALLALL